MYTYVWLSFIFGFLNFPASNQLFLLCKSNYNLENNKRRLNHHIIRVKGNFESENKQLAEIPRWKELDYEIKKISLVQ